MPYKSSGLQRLNFYPGFELTNNSREKKITKIHKGSGNLFRFSNWMIRSPYLKKYQYCIVLVTLYSFGRIQCCQYFYRLLPLPSFQSALYKTINGNKTSDRTIWWAACLPPHLEILHSFAHCCMLGKWVSATPGCDCPAAGNVSLRRHFIRSFHLFGT